MHSPLAMQALAHFSDSAEPLPKRRMSSTPDTTATGSASARPAAGAIGQALKQAPHLVQASSMSSMRPVRASSNPVFCMELRIAQIRPDMTPACDLFSPGSVAVSDDRSAGLRQLHQLE